MPSALPPEAPRTYTLNSERSVMAAPVMQAALRAMRVRLPISTMHYVRVRGSGHSRSLELPSRSTRRRR
eukprot:scaffold175_cov414-Prasinococcus_capsulatus_cf.AAC.38